MKDKTKLKVIQILCIISVLITILAIQRTYARYFEQVSTTYVTDVKKWVINVNTYNIHEKETLNQVMQPILIENVNMNNDVLVPGREGYFEMLLDYSYVDLKFDYEFTIEQLNTQKLEDFEIYGYEVVNTDGTSTKVDTKEIKGTINPATDLDGNGEKKKNIKVLFRWYDEEGNIMENVDDTQYRGETDTSAEADGLHTVFKYMVTVRFNQHVDQTTSPFLPRGFSEVAGTSLATGLTIQDSKGNQYVWVEVPRTTEVYRTAGLGITEFTDSEYTAIENDLHTYTSVYRNGTSYTDTYSGDDSSTGLTSAQYTELKQKMLKSVYQNGGFYVGKYETGIENAPKTSGSSTTAPTQPPVIKQNAYPYNYVTCSQAQTLASKFASGLDGYTSSLMFGVQWDLVLKYLETKGATQSELKTNSRSWGNYADNLWNITNTSSKYSYNGSNWTSGAYGEKTEESRILLSTGASDTFSKQGIYDLAGNVCEWTLEYPFNERYECIGRGGNYHDVDFSAGTRSMSNSTTYDEFSGAFGFRVSLY